MSDDRPPTDTAVASPEMTFEPVRSLGTSPTGESFEVVQQPLDDDLLDEESEPGTKRFVLKKITRARLRAPERFRQKFAALCRLDQPNLCPYRELYIGEKATRITRDFVDGLPLDEYLLQPITDDESAELSRSLEELDEEDKQSPDDGDVDAPSAEEEPEKPDESAVEKAPDAADNPPSSSTSENEPSEDDPPTETDSDEELPDRPSTLEIPATLMEDSDAADRALDLIILRLRRIIPPLVDALEYLHRFRHVHGNLTPSNILITDDEEVILTDYGLHPELEIDAEARQRFASYHAPEIERGEYRPESDLYALGAILFEVLANCRYGTRRRADTPNGTDTSYSPVYLSEIVPHCPASWVDLTHALLASDPDDRPPLDDVHRQLAAMEARSVNIPASVVDAPETLYGRSDSLERLSDAAKSSSQQRQFGFAIVEGETGVGKTALLETLARRAAQRGWVVLHGRCFHREPIAYQGWGQIAKRLADIIDDLPETPRQRLRHGRRRAARLFPQLKMDSDERAIDITRRAAVDGFRQLLRGLSAQRPILICFDDLHWAGRDSMRLLADLVERPRGMRVMVVATGRPESEKEDPEHSLWTEFATAPIDVERIAIEGFSKGEAREYVLAHGGHLSLRQKQKVLRRGGLNPLLIDELIYELDDEAEPSPAEDGDGEETNEETVEDDGETIDHHLRSFVAERLTELTRAERLALQLLAIASAPLSAKLIGRAMSRELGTQTSDVVTGREVAESLVEQRLARRARQLESSSDAPPRYVVVHDLCRRVILDELGQDHHARLCGLIADALASGDEAVDDLRFEYLLRAGRGEEATRAAVLAARTAVDRFAYHRATRLWLWLQKDSELDERDQPAFAAALLGAGHYEEAVEQLDRLLPAPSMDTDLRRRRQRVSAQMAHGNRRAAIDAMDDALAASSIPYSRRSLMDRLADVGRRLTGVAARWSDPTASAGETPPTTEMHAVAESHHFALQTAPYLLTHTYRPIQSRFRILARKTRYGPHLATNRLLMIGAPELPFLMRDGNQIDRWLHQATTLAGRFDDREIEARALEMTALVARHRGRVGDAIDHIDAANRLVDRGEASSSWLQARLLQLHVDALLSLGEVDEAGAHIDQLRHRYRHRRDLSALANLTACDRDLLIGNLDGAERRLDEVTTFIGDHRNTLIDLWMMDRRTRLNIARGRADVAVGEWDLALDRAYTRALRRQPRARWLIHLNLTRSLAAVAERQKTLNEIHHRESMRRLRRSLRRLGDLEAWAGCLERACMYRLRSRYALIRERPQRALRYAQRAVEAAGEHAPPVARAMNQEAVGAAMRRLEEPDARTMREKAFATYDELGIYLPLVLEGWPVPASHARLHDDEP